MPRKPMTLEEIIEEGEHYLNMLDFKKASTCFNRAIKEAPDDPRGYFGKAETFIGVPKMTAEEISEFYEKAISLDSQPLYYARYGSFCTDVGFFDKAEECYLKASELDESNAPHYLSEFAIELATYARENKAQIGLKKEREMLAKSLDFCLKAMGLTWEDAVEIAKSREQPIP